MTRRRDPSDDDAPEDRDCSRLRALRSRYPEGDYTMTPTEKAQARLTREALSYAIGALTQVRDPWDAARLVADLRALRDAAAAMDTGGPLVTLTEVLAERDTRHGRRA